MSRMYMIAPGVIFLIIDLGLIVRGLLCPSFSIIRTTYNFNTIVAPVLFLASALIMGVLWRKRKLSASVLHAAMTYFCICIALVGVRIYATHIEPHRLVLREVSFKSSKVTQPLRILHISDIQSAGIGQYERDAFLMMQALQPDLIIHTGDLLQPLPPARFDPELLAIMGLFRDLHPSLGIYGVYGDVDDPLQNVPENMLGRVHLLENAEAAVVFGSTRIRLFGLANDSSRSPQKTLPLIRNWLSKSGPTDFNILLGHSPDYAVAAQDFPLDLCLAGHTHGGQIRIPFFGPILTLTDYIPRSWAAGYREIGQTRLNVSAGIGSEHAKGLPSIRVNCLPEMTLIVINNKSSDAQTLLFGFYDSNPLTSNHRQYP